MADTRADQQAVETLARAAPQRALLQQSAEVLAREQALRLYRQETETLAVPAPDMRLAHIAVEVMSLPHPPARFMAQAVEVVWREAATPDILVWRHNWVAEVRERLEFSTDVLTARDGQ